MWWKAPLGALGGRETSPWPPPPPSRSHLLGPAPPHGTPIYSGGRGGISHQPLAPPSPPLRLSLVVSAKPCFCDALHPPPRRRAAGSSSTSPPPLLDQEGGDVSRPVRVLNAEVSSVRRWSSVIWITSSTITSSPCKLPHAIYKWYVDANSLPRLVA